MSTNQNDNQNESLYDEDDVENYVIYEEEDDEDEDWGWEEDESDDDDDDDELYVYVDEDGNIIEEDDEDYDIDDEEHEYYDEESEMSELIGIVSGNSSKTDENDGLSDLDALDEEEPYNDKSPSQNANKSTLDNDHDLALHSDNTDNSNNDKKINFNVKQKISEFSNKFNDSNKFNADEILEPYDSFIGKVLGTLSKIPIIGKFFMSLGNKKIISRLSPIIIITIVLSVLFGISFITSPSKTSVILLPDMGEITVTSENFNKDDESMNVIISNTGDVIIPASATLSLYTYNPTINPLTLIGFEEIGKCEITNIIIDIDKEEEHSIPCNFIGDNTIENVKYRTIVSHQEDSEE